jgi:hypothetical protein
MRLTISFRSSRYIVKLARCPQSCIGPHLANAIVAAHNASGTAASKKDLSRTIRCTIAQGTNISGIKAMNTRGIASKMPVTAKEPNTAQGDAAQARIV